MKTISEIGRIYKALYTSYEMLEKEKAPQEEALASLKEAEHSLQNAIKYVLLQNGRRVEK